jgi:predicted permease
LLITAGLFLRNLRNLQNVDPGFNPEGILVFRIDPTLNGYQDEKLGGLYDQILSRLETLPGVVNASMTPYPPLSGRGAWDHVKLPEGDEIVVFVGLIDADYLETLEIPMLMGRALTPRDDHRSPKVALVNETFARQAFGGENPLGRRFGFSGYLTGDEIQIVGVFRDSKNESLKRDTQATVFLPYRQASRDLGVMTFLLRFQHGPESLLPLVRKTVAAVDPNLPLFETKTLTAQIDESMLQERQFARLSTLGGVLALGLACIGLYGTLSQSVNRRTQEIGIRMALGAERADILRSVMKEMLLVGLGATLGLAGAWALTRWLASMLFQLTATDPPTLLLATLLMVGVAALAVYFPARRASRVDPMETLRFE